jgi:hypothetical protein
MGLYYRYPMLLLISQSLPCTNYLNELFWHNEGQQEKSSVKIPQNILNTKPPKRQIEETKDKKRLSARAKRKMKKTRNNNYSRIAP